MKKVWLVGLFALTGAGCFSFSDSSVAPPGRTARVTLAATETTPGGRPTPIRLEGLIVDSDLGGTGVLALEQTKSRPLGNFREHVTVDTLRIPSTDMTRLEVRRVSWFKSTLAVGVFGAIVYTMVDRFSPSFEGR